MSYAAKPVPSKDRAGEESNSLGLVSLILGIVGLVTGGCPFSIGATVTGWMGMKREPAGTAKIGFWLGVVGMVLQTLLGLILLLFFGAALGLGLTAVEMQPAPPAPPVVVSGELAPPLIEPAPAVDAVPVEPAIEANPEGGPIEPSVEETPPSAP